MKLSVHTICFIGMFAAVTAVLSIVVLPTPWGVPFTLQTFSVALCGYVLGARYGTLSIALYLLLGLIGIPVYAGMKAGPGVLFGPTGGYLFGFLLMALFSGLAGEYANRAENRRSSIGILIFLSALALAGCHIPGVIQLKLVTGVSLRAAAVSGSLPYLLKDVLSVAGACAVAYRVKRRLAGFVFFHKSASKS